jgi:hypothetical protein
MSPEGVELRPTLDESEAAVAEGVSVLGRSIAHS